MARFDFNAFGGPYVLVAWSDLPPEAEAHVVQESWAVSTFRAAGEHRELSALRLVDFCITVRAGAYWPDLGQSCVDWVCERLLTREIRMVRAQAMRPGPGHIGTNPLDLALQKFWGAFGTPFTSQGKTYRLVVPEVWEDLRRDGTWEALRHDRALAVFDRLATRTDRPLGPEAVNVIRKAVSHPSLQGSDRVFLIEQIRHGQAGGVAHEAVTPEQLKRWVEKKKQESKGWIEIRLVDPFERPMAGCKVEVTDAEGNKQSAALDQQGFVRLEPISRQGPASIAFPRLPNHKGKDVEGTQTAVPHSLKIDAKKRFVVVPIRR